MDDVSTASACASGAELPAPAFENDQSSLKSAATACQHRNYVTAIYITGHRNFWLLPDEALDEIEKSAKRLASTVSLSGEGERIKALEAQGLADLFLPPHPRSFLPTMLQNEWLRLEAATRENQKKVAPLGQELQKMKDLYRKSAREMQENQAPTEEQLALRNRHQAEIAKVRVDGEFKLANARTEIANAIERIEELRQQGLDAAEKAGFLVENGTLFSPHQKLVKEKLTEYKKVRKAFEQRFYRDETAIHLFLDLCRYHQEILEYRLQGTAPDTKLVEKYAVEIAQLDHAIKPYADCILTLASLGIVMPEYAFANGEKDLRKGVATLGSYHKLNFELDNAREELESVVEEWVTVLGQNGPVPSPALNRLREQVEEQKQQQFKLRQKAEILARGVQPPRLFIWDPEDFESRPYQALVKPGMPLREYTAPHKADKLYHFILTDLPGVQKRIGGEHPLPEHEVYQSESPETIALALRHAQRPGEDKVLEEVLTALGGKKVPLDKQWYDDQGLFDPEQFYNDLAKQHQVRALKSPETRAKWGEHLRTLLWEEDSRKHLMVFDDSYTAQLMRLVLGGLDRDVREHLRDKVELTLLEADGPGSEVSVSLNSKGSPISYSLAEARIGADLTYLQGQIDLLNLELPKRTDSESLVIPYDTEGGAAELDMGRFSCNLNVKLSGFAGASMLLSSSLGLEITPGEGIQLSGYDKGEKAGEYAKLKAFAGIKASTLTAMDLYWNLPAEARRRVNYTRTEQPLEEWFRLGKVAHKLTGSLGLGVDLSFMITLHNNRLYYYTKSSIVTGLGGSSELAFEVNFEAIPLLMSVLQTELHNNGYRHVYWISPDAFNFLASLNFLRLSTGMNLVFLATRGIDVVEKAFAELNKSERAGMVALRITRAIDGEDSSDDELTLKEYEEWFRGLQPEAVGPLLNHLVAEAKALETAGARYSEEQVLVMQQRSILRCVHWIRRKSIFVKDSDRRQFEESLVRMNMRGKKETDELGANLEKLTQFMNNRATDIGYSERKSDYEALIEELTPTRGIYASL